ncbi:hypothetical protein [Metabacillus malikii]|uniref:LysM domain-containing protein n=1 Tax=Metabacillus malikii TaxID=1504265 RepID=A0ABT9ZH60_9BACI|nr:hypothetical protein [Metabacillus malikii]MDQ0231627.1 hypothetical protein [Metabacillus malikii]
MKRLSLFLFFLFLIFIVYYDMNVGTLPTVNEPSVKESINSVEEKTKPSIPFHEVKVSEGDTVLSITEKLHSGLPAPIDKIIEDFELLNENIKAESIIIGETYLFPDYTQ